MGGNARMRAESSAFTLIHLSGFYSQAFNACLKSVVLLFYCCCFTAYIGVYSFIIYFLLILNDVSCL